MNLRKIGSIFAAGSLLLAGCGANAEQPSIVNSAIEPGCPVPSAKVDFNSDGSVSLLTLDTCSQDVPGGWGSEYSGAVSFMPAEVCGNMGYSEIPNVAGWVIDANGNASLVLNCLNKDGEQVDVFVTNTPNY